MVSVTVCLLRGSGSCEEKAGGNEREMHGEGEGRQIGRQASRQSNGQIDPTSERRTNRPTTFQGNRLAAIGFAMQSFAASRPDPIFSKPIFGTDDRVLAAVCIGAPIIDFVNLGLNPSHARDMLRIDHIRNGFCHSGAPLPSHDGNMSQIDHFRNGFCYSGAPSVL